MSGSIGAARFTGLYVRLLPAVRGERSTERLLAAESAVWTGAFALVNDTTAAPISRRSRFADRVAHRADQDAIHAKPGVDLTFFASSLKVA